MKKESLVSRGTPDVTVTPPVYPLIQRRKMRTAIVEGDKSTVRLPLSESNSELSAGYFGDLLLETGRAKHEAKSYLRARCRFGLRERVVTVEPSIRQGHLFWLRHNRHHPRAESDVTLHVVRVGLSRLQDMGSVDLGMEGYPDNNRLGFAKDWDLTYIGTPHSWSSNPWVWVVQFDVSPWNVDQILAER